MERVSKYGEGDGGGVSLDRETVITAAALLKRRDEALALKGTLAEGEHKLVLYARSRDDCIEDDITIEDADLTDAILRLVISKITDEVTALGVTGIGTA
jgi:hypothetical protein